MAGVSVRSRGIVRVSRSWKHVTVGAIIDLLNRRLAWIVYVFIRTDLDIRIRQRSSLDHRLRGMSNWCTWIVIDEDGLVTMWSDGLVVAERDCPTLKLADGLKTKLFVFFSEEEYFHILLVREINKLCLPLESQF